MRSSKSRSRNKSNRNRNNPGNIINRVYDSSGPEGKVRGTPQQIIDKYNQLTRDAFLSNDRVAGENFQQHADTIPAFLGKRSARSRRVVSRPISKTVSASNVRKTPVPNVPRRRPMAQPSSPCRARARSLIWQTHRSLILPVMMTTVWSRRLKANRAVSRPAPASRASPPARTRHRLQKPHQHPLQRIRLAKLPSNSPSNWP